ncbi:hypothetical protein GCM10011331_17690 [Flavimobilis marinus]|uniref:Sulfite exporter TauE/SafE n=1 Tax=Flavimobilis marinus TaxID=285351 RepID=A0A1I2F8T0_9MICO|nr:sulfite exporter TauE/SafE family protein [Flavimobilis marinus]GHG52693.1 hypothetical protein GCM10011331_17690 [Flavimobilis marinus]SFF01585.1 Sulfite exporter TauE/SafE [Flavimobilis marinus]
MTTTTIPVEGMTCRACEVRVARALEKLDGVDRAQVSARRGRAVLHGTRAPSPADVARALEAAGYRRGPRSPWVTRDVAVWRDVAITVGVLVALAALVSVTGAGTTIDRLATLGSSGSLVLVVLLGVAAGFSTCMALVGGLVLAVSASHAEARPELRPRELLRPHVAFNLGRVAGFAVLGAVLGAAGSVVGLSGTAVGWLTLTAGAVMAVVGLRLTGVAPRLAQSLTLALPPRAAAVLRPRGGRYSDTRTALLGAGTFLLPCGFTQAVQVYALSTGSPGRAAAVMALFALGTAPGLIGVGTLTALARGRGGERVFRVAGVAVLAFAGLTVTGAVGVLAPGLGAPALVSSPATSVSANVTLEDGTQVLRTVQVASGYEPAHAVVRAGTPVRWEIDSQAASCAASISARDLGLPTFVLDPGVNAVAFTPPEPGQYRFSCAMGMYWGSLTVIAADA